MRSWYSNPSYTGVPGSTDSAQTAIQASMPQMPQARLDLAEEDLIRRVQEGDKEAFYDLVRPYERAVFFAAKSVLENDADAEEAAQEAVLKAFTQYPRLPRREQVQHLVGPDHYK
jgi:hypothetical protein